MDVATMIYERCLFSKNKRKKIWFKARKRLIRFGKDPGCSLSAHGRRLRMPLSHDLPRYLKNHEFYDTLPTRLGAYIRQKKGRLICIDVGANIGDSIAAFYKDESDAFLAIEPNQKFFKYLVENWGGCKNITLISDVCLSENVDGSFLIAEKRGTASVIKADGGDKMRGRSLDDIVTEIPSVQKCNVLKIDTDGHDFEVLKGARGLVDSAKPSVFFECDTFGNTNYFTECIDALSSFERVGYKHFLVYDNVGYLIGKYKLSCLSSFKALLFYQLTGGVDYFDILVMPDDDLLEFYRDEVGFFIGKMANKNLQESAMAAATGCCGISSTDK